MKKENINVGMLAGKVLIKLGEQAVGKCLIPGMFDPKIPDEIKVNTVKEIKK